ncbi:MAG: HPr family phosphocarrier protein [Verrucomicrobiota bacterium]
MSLVNNEKNEAAEAMEIEIKNKLGLHARPAAMFVRIANQFTSEITVEKDNEQVNGKSIMDLMMLAAGRGSLLRITADGEDADEALKAIADLAERKFDEE